MDTNKITPEEERHKRKWKHKSLLVWQILLENTDENHAMSSTAIRDALEERGIEAEEHSIRRDIKDLIELLDKMQEADILAESQDRINYGLKYDASLKGYHIYQRPRCANCTYTKVAIIGKNTQNKGICHIKCRLQ